jgi:5,10-methylenetetrahydrofolate reductase
MNVLLQQKITDPNQGVYLIGTTPPKAGTDKDKLANIADKLLRRLDGIAYDGLIVYDIQDESARISTPRPFEFKATVDPRQYSQLLSQQSAAQVITYKSVAQRSEAEFKQWLDETQKEYKLDNLVLVGSPSSSTNQVKLSLNDAYRSLSASDTSVFLGGVTIAERHRKKRNEHKRLLEKTRQGCEFFISQAVYDAQATIDMLTSYAQACQRENIKPSRVILTFTPCGGEKTLDFMQWLGISVPPSSKMRIVNAHNPLNQSITLCRENLNYILLKCSHLGVPLGLNIESLTNRKAEIDASVNLYRLLKATMELHLAERQIEGQWQSAPTGNVPLYQLANNWSAPDRVHR